MKGTKPSNVLAGKQPVRDVLKPPTWLSKHAKAEWRRVMPSLVERRVLDTADLGNLENYCLCIGRVREIEEQLRKGFDPALDRAQSKAIATARQLAALFGLSPVDRSRPTLPNADDDDEASDLFGD